MRTNVRGWNPETGLAIFSAFWSQRLQIEREKGVEAELERKRERNVCTKVHSCQKKVSSARRCSPMWHKQRLTARWVSAWTRHRAMTSHSIGIAWPHKKIKRKKRVIANEALMRCSRSSESPRSGWTNHGLQIKQSCSEDPHASASSTVLSALSASSSVCNMAVDASTGAKTQSTFHQA